MENLGWLLSFVSILGAIANIKKNKIGFVIWSFGNIGWMILSIWVSAYRSQLPLWIVFTVLNVWGWLQWRKDEETVLERTKEK